jgi:proteasome lid subunit RPN8/RPN11
MDFLLASNKIIYINKSETLRLTSTDGQFGISLETKQVQKIISYCLTALPNETGGILVGKYNYFLNTAEIEEIIKAPKDSGFGGTWFHRGVKGLKSQLQRFWKNNKYYLGEWHFHPLSSPLPSKTDIMQIKEIARDKRYNCPEPILLIIGGNPTDNCSVYATIFSVNQGLIELHK